MKRWIAPKNGGYIVFRLEGFNAVVPQSDIKPHNWDKLTCPCGPSVEADKDGHHVIHSSFEENAALEASLKSIGL